jgi:hypothetical protein
MLHQQLSPVERKLIAREGSREWSFAREREFRWLIVLGSLLAAGAMYFAVQMWLSGAIMLP